jgi:hypothetical protein
MKVIHAECQRFRSWPKMGAFRPPKLNFYGISDAVPAGPEFAAAELDRAQFFSHWSLWIQIIWSDGVTVEHDKRR